MKPQDPQTKQYVNTSVEKKVTQEYHRYLQENELEDTVAAAESFVHRVTNDGTNNYYGRAGAQLFDIICKKG